MVSIKFGNAPIFAPTARSPPQFSFPFHNAIAVRSPQSLKLIIDPLVASFIPVTNAFIVLAIVISFCISPLTSPRMLCSRCCSFDINSSCDICNTRPHV